MNTLNQRAALAILTTCLLFTGCASKVTYDFDPAANFSRLHTYDFAVLANAGAPPLSVTNPFLDQRIQLALNQSLQAKGYVRLQGAKPDFQVAYVLVRENFVAVTYYGGVGWASMVPPPGQYPPGTLLLDIINPATQKLIWHGAVTKAVDQSKPPQDQQKSLDQAVKKLLVDFPPPKSGY